MKISNKKKKLFIFIIVVVVLVSFISIGLIVSFKNKKAVSNELKTNKEEIDKHYDKNGYKLNENATEYEKSLFKELEIILDNEEINYENYANVLAKLFVTDLFTLDTKDNSNDITSVQYVYSDYQDNYKELVKDGIYSNIELNLDGKRLQELPRVKNVEIVDVKRESFSLKDNVIDSEAFRISLNISYEKDLKYPSDYVVVLIKKDSLLYVVKSFEN